jgi:predicted tellurium resistance membrane protein TerC
MRAIVLVALVVGVLAANASEAPVTVQAELADRTKVKGPWSIENLKFANDLGLFDFPGRRVKQISLNGPGQDFLDVDGLDQRLRGTVEIANFVIDGKSYPRGQVRTLKQVRGGPPNVLTDILMPLVTLTAMEIVLGIDNIIFLAIVAGKLPRNQQPKARRIGLFAALATRLLLLATLTFILGLTAPVFTLPNLPFLAELEAREISWRDIILLVGGMFLIGKSTFEIHDKLERPVESHAQSARSVAGFGMVLLQIAIIDIIFSLDSVITAVGMVGELWIMVTAMIVAVAVMLMFAETISKFVARNPTLKILALSFLILIGVLLVAEGFGQHINKGYVYFAMAFSVVVEVINIRIRKKTEPLLLQNAELPAGIH